MHRLLDARHWSHHALCGALVALTLLGPRVAAAQQPAAPGPLPKSPDEVAPDEINTTLVADPAVAAAKKLNLSGVLPYSCLVVAVRPAQILRSPAAELYPVEVLQAAMIKEFGIDPLAAEQVVASVTPPLAGPPGYSVLAQFDGPVQLKPSPLTEHTAEATLNGKKYLRSQQMGPPSLFMPDDSTIVAAPEYSMPQVMRGGASPQALALATRLAAAAQGDDFLAMLDVAPLRNLIQMGLAQADLPPELPELAQLPSLIKTVELRLNFSHAGATEALVSANNEADAEKLVGIFKKAKQIIADKAAAQAKQALASDDPVEQAAGRYSQRMSKFWDARLQLQKEGDRLVLFRLSGDGGEQAQLVTVAVVGVLVALLLPAVQAAREAARRSVSMNNMKQILLGMMVHHDAKGHFPPQANFDADGKPLLSWRVHILPYIEQQELFNQFHLDEPWDSPHNKTLISKMPEIYLDPSSNLAVEAGRTHYLGVEGEGKLFDPKRKEGRKITSISDGTSNTMAVVQVADAHTIEWTKPDDCEISGDNPAASIGALHSGIFIAGFCDGHVNAISMDVDPKMLKAMSTVAGGEEVYP